jgi:hypothetical protein
MANRPLRYLAPAPRVQILADPLADARAWLAAMESSMRRVGQQAAQQSDVLPPKRSSSSCESLGGET